MPPHPLTNFEIQKYYQSESKFNCVYSRNNLPKIKNGAYVINLDEFRSIETHWVASFVNFNNGSTSYDTIYINSFGVEHIPKVMKKFVGKKKIITNIYRIQVYNSIICGYFCIRFIDFMVKSKSLLNYKNLYSPNEYEKNDKIILKYFH